VIIRLRSVVLLTSYFAIILKFSLAMSFWPDPVLLVSIVLMAAHADLEGVLAIHWSSVWTFVPLFCGATGTAVD